MSQVPRPRVLLRTRAAAGRPAAAKRGLVLGNLGALVAHLVVMACGGGEQKLVGPAAGGCATPPWFIALPVALPDIDGIVVFGGLGAPGHTLPTAHSGLYLAREGAEVRSPGAMQVTVLGRVRYLVSPNRQGHSDYTAEFQICQQVTGWFGHLSTLAPKLDVPPSQWRDCSTYSTATETVESCRAQLDRVTLSAGESMGTGGFSIQLGLMGLDFGLLDSRVNNQYAAAWRHPDPTFHAICPWEQFESSLKTQLYAKLQDKGRPGVVPAGEPRCGTMQVDVVGTAKGVWAEPTVTTPVAGDETRYITLADYPYRPQDHLALSLGPHVLGARVAVVQRATVGRVNRAFEQVTADGQIYCYGPDVSVPGMSWLLSLTGSTSLSIRRVLHGIGDSPCLADPATWSLASSQPMVR